VVKNRGVNNLTERVPVDRLVGCKYLKGEKKNIIGRGCQGKAYNSLIDLKFQHKPKYHLSKILR